MTMNNQHFSSNFLFIGLSLMCFIQGMHCGVIPELTVKKSGSENKTAPEEASIDANSKEENLGSSYDQKRLNCMWLAYQAMLTGDEKYLTQDCIDLFLSSSKQDSKEDLDSSELLNELQEVSSQQRPVQSDPDVTITRGNGETDGKIDNTQVEEIPRVNSEDGVFENEETLEPLTPDGIDAPFVTSVKEINEDFLVIPIKYLKSQLGSDSDDASNVDNGNDENRNQLDQNEDSLTGKDPKENDKDQSMTEEEATVAKKNSDSFDGDDISNLENALLTLQNEHESSNEQPNIDVLHQVQDDINRLEQDLRAMEAKTA